MRNNLISVTWELSVKEGQFAQEIHDGFYIIEHGLKMTFNNQS